VAKRKRSTAHLRKYQFKKKRAKRSRPVAKRRRKRSRPGTKTFARRRRRHGNRPAPKRRRRGGGGASGGFSLKPSGDDTKLWIASAGIGWLETKAKSDGNFILNKVPKPIDALGYTGNTAIALWVLSHFVRNKWLRLGARAAAGITAYHLGRMGKTFSKGEEFFSVSGWSDDEVAEMLQAQSLGALNPTGDAMPGTMAYDDADVVY